VVVLLVSIVGLLYAYTKSIPAVAALSLLLAILVEVSLYLAAGFESVRVSLEKRLPSPQLALSMTASALPPYLIYSVAAGRFRWSSLLVLAGLAAVVSFWYVVFPKSALTDLAFVAVIAVVILARIFPHVYASPAPRLRVEFLGQLMWIRLGIVSVLSIRGMEGTGFGFLPSRRDWTVGLRYFLLFLPVGAALAWSLGFASFGPHPRPWWVTALLTAGTFTGMLWVVALSEEFFFRGLLQQWLSRWLDNRWAGLVCASALFGLVHLPFRSFPNWEFAGIAAVAGLFYGLAYLQAGSIRAAMVAHALVNTTWRVFFS
jgi:membrane protease YdiL (CAAX protease family)